MKLPAFSPIARGLAILSGLALPAISSWQLLTNITDEFVLALAPYCIAIGVLVALVETPQLCACYPWCKTAARYLKFVSGYWISRGLLYLGAGAGGFTIYQFHHQYDDQNQTFILLTLIALTLSGSCYVMAAVKGEEPPARAAENREGAQPVPSTGAAKEAGGSSGSSGGLFGLFGGGSKSSVDAAVAAAAGAAAPSIASAMFNQATGFGGSASGGDGYAGFGSSSMSGGGGLEAGALSAGPAAAPEQRVVYDVRGGDDDDDLPAGLPASSGSSSGGVFAGGGLFGGGAAVNKYGYASDAPESNPFMG